MQQRKCYKALDCSIDPVASAGAVDLFESGGGTEVEYTFGFEALVLIVTVGMHAGFECGEVDWADFGQNVHTGGALILTSEAIQAIKLKSRMEFVNVKASKRGVGRRLTK